MTISLVDHLEELGFKTLPRRGISFKDLPMLNGTEGEPSKPTSVFNKEESKKKNLTVAEIPKKPQMISIALMKLQLLGCS